ncbi:leucine-rich repeat domain-containing protein [Tannerella forsythia]|uniref:T9SS C-terminal target domain-containing protein n=1 Tax=Tannerella forsythia TaxID=28112 RepID=A0A3P1YS83_TANFO|nr:leucine-rich repeat domain-containing protein [Tannerella forsythia]RRD73565.1 T9SS C-terminal target domain-containing protein [Tannerella forsythia]
MKKKTFTLIMGLLLTALGAAAQNSGTTGPLTWNYNAGTKTLSITGTGAMPDYTFPGGTNRPWHAFRDEIKTVSIGNGVTSVGKCAFTECSKLQSITLPATLTEIKFHGFSYCKALQSITLPAVLTKIEDYAFIRCPALTAFKVDPGNAHFTAADGVLYNKAKTRLIYYPAGKPATSFTVPAGITRIGPCAFDGCKELQSITLPATLTEIEFHGFFNCTALQSITLPATLTEIGYNAFYGCTSLKSIHIPSAVSDIAYSAFKNCKALTEVIVGWDTPLAIDADVFDNVTLSGVTLKVPKGTKAKYQAAPVWKDFKINETTANQTVDGLRVFAAGSALYLTLPKAETVHIYNVEGALVKTLALPSGDHVQPLPSGVYLVQTGERVTKILIK